MVKNLKAAIILFVALSAAMPVQAASLAFTPAGTAAASSSDLTRIGIAAAVKGQVRIERGGKVGAVMESGQPVYLGDVVRTDSKGHLQILLLDQTTFTVGPNSAITIDEFVYDPATHEGKVKAEILEGTFRFITGKIAKKKPENMEVKIPNGSIGIRGTIVAGKVGNNNSTVMLLGPGENNNTGERTGRAIVSSDNGGNNNGGGDQTDLNRSGYGCNVNEQGVSPPFQVPAEQLQQIIDAFKPVAGDEEEQEDNSQGSGQNNNSDPGNVGGGNATEKSGQQRVEVRDRVHQQRIQGGLLRRLNQDSNESSQQGSEKAGDTVPDGITRIQDLAKMQSGIFHYEGGGILFDVSNPASRVATVHSYQIFFDIDFGARTVGGANSRVLIPVAAFPGGATAGDVLFPLDVRDFGNGGNDSGFLAGSYHNVPSAVGACGFGPACTANVDLAVLNSGGNVATHLASHVFAQKGSSSLDGVAIVPRQDGPSPP